MTQDKKTEITSDFEVLLRRIGLNEKEVQIYLTLLELGPSPVRSIAVKSRINRGTAYEILKSLIDRGLVSYFEKTRHQHFAAEDPSKLLALVEYRSRELIQTKAQLVEILPLLEGRQGKPGGRPRVRFFEGTRGVRTILEDVLETMRDQEEKLYRVYSFADVREHLYVGFRDFVDRRIKLGIHVKTIALGPGGKLWGLDERRWLKGADGALTYQLVYADKFAMISLDEGGNPVTSLVEDPKIADTQRVIFDNLWGLLGPGAEREPNS
jgi:sugar-specific transcriptional regulator TrmB